MLTGPKIDGWPLWDGIFPNHCWKTLAKRISAPPSLAAHPSLLVPLPVRSMRQRTRGPCQSLKNISDQVLYKNTSRIQGWRKSHFLRFDAFVAAFNLAPPIITYHPCRPHEGSTPWLPIPCLHLSHLGLFAIVLPRNQLNPPLQRSAIRASEDWDLHLSSHVDSCWFIVILFWPVSSGGLVWWMDGSCDL